MTAISAAASALSALQVSGAASVSGGGQWQHFRQHGGIVSE